MRRLCLESWQKTQGINSAQGESRETCRFRDGDVFSSDNKNRRFWISPLDSHRQRGTCPSGNSGETCCSQREEAVNPAELGKKGAPLRETKTYSGKTPPTRCVEVSPSGGDNGGGLQLDTAEEPEGPGRSSWLPPPGWGPGKLHRLIAPAPGGHSHGHGHGHGVCGGGESESKGFCPIGTFGGGGTSRDAGLERAVNSTKASRSRGRLLLPKQPFTHAPTLLGQLCCGKGLFLSFLLAKRQNLRTVTCSRSWRNHGFLKPGSRTTGKGGDDASEAPGCRVPIPAHGRRRPLKRVAPAGRAWPSSRNPFATPSPVSVSHRTRKAETRGSRGAAANARRVPSMLCHVPRCWVNSPRGKTHKRGPAGRSSPPGQSNGLSVRAGGRLLPLRQKPRVSLGVSA